MESAIKVISRETIKPSSPTPKSLNKYDLSFLDQLAPLLFEPMINFYPKSDDTKLTNSEKSNHLKKSLSQVLSIFYPLAGRLRHHLHVDCNDEGVPFIEAEAHCHLSQAITDPIPRNMNAFLPCKLDDVQDLLMAVQLTYFRCGGLAVGLVISHKIADACSFFLFANAWAAAAKSGGAADIPRPKFDSAAIFPPRDVTGYYANAGVEKEELAGKIFTFPAAKISILRERYSGGRDGDSRPTRVEALSAFIWSRFIAATEEKPDPNKTYMIVHAVNLRSRTEPPLMEHQFGNIAGISIAKLAVGGGGYEVTEKVREAIGAVGGEYVARLNNGDKHLDFMNELMLQTTKGQLVFFCITSLCRFPMYEADFGWGRPVRVGSSVLAYRNLITFMDTANGDGIEAWINMEKHDMEKFEADLELQHFLA